ncbi:MAG: hypothetical protein HY556_07575 [Euryarchaeota archaeon]|nr:hypothetical protein [Euryarchaeota archaeon]
MGPEESPDGASDLGGAQPHRRLALGLMLLSFPSFIVGNAFVLFAWLFAAVPFALLARNRTTRRAAVSAFVVLVICVVAALMLAGGIRGVPRITPSPEVQRWAGALGLFGMWYAVSVFVAIAPLNAPRFLQKAGCVLSLGGFVVGSFWLLLGQPAIPDFSPGFVLSLAFLSSLIGSALVFLSLISELVGFPAPRSPAPPAAQ